MTYSLLFPFNITSHVNYAMTSAIMQQKNISINVNRQQIKFECYSLVYRLPKNTEKPLFDFLPNELTSQHKY